MRLFYQSKCITPLLTIAFFLSTAVATMGNFYNNIEILEDTGGIIPTELLNNTRSWPFSKYSNYQLKKDHTYWLRFAYTQSDIGKSYYLTYHFILYKNLELHYLVDGKLYSHYYDINSHNSPFQIPNIYLPLPSSNKSVVCLLKVVPFQNLSFFIHETENEETLYEQTSQASLEYFFIGVGALTVFFSILFFIFLRNPLYFYYGLYSFLLIISRLTYNGYILNYLPSFYKIYNNVV